MNAVIGAAAAAGFILFAGYDLAALRKKTGPFSRCGFAAGCVLWLIAAGLTAYACRDAVLPGLRGAFAAAGACLSAGLLVWALFFSLPKGTYSDPSARRRAYNEKLYALCRHPGLLFFGGMCVFLRLLLGRGSAFGLGLLFAFDLAYVVLQDRIVFPRVFVDYAAYCRYTPFLIPSAESFRRCVRQCINRKDSGT